MIKAIKDLVVEAIDKGSNTAEDFTKSIAGLPFETLAKIGPFADSINGLKGLQEQSTDKVYDMIRNMNQQVGDYAENFLEKSEKTKGQETDTEKQKPKAVVKPKPKAAEKPKSKPAAKPKSKAASKPKPKTAEEPKLKVAE